MATRRSATGAGPAITELASSLETCTSVIVGPSITPGEIDAKSKARMTKYDPMALPPNIECDSTGHSLLQPVACSSKVPAHTPIFPSNNGLITAVRLAYNQHLPLRLRPDDIWLCVLNSISTHVNKNAEKYRSSFVQHAGKQELVVDVPFTSTADVDWPDVVGKITSMVAERTVADIVDLMTPTFSTTDAISGVASSIVIMSAMKAYFSYTMRTRCGIREVRMEGTEADWDMLRTKVAAFRRVEKLGEDLSEWLDRMDGVLKQLHDTACGRPDVVFWSHIYNIDDPYGSGAVTTYGGWFLTFFLYNAKQVLIKHEHNPMLEEGELPCAYSTVPVVWQRLSERIPLQLFAGSWNAALLPDGSVAPCMQWLVAEEKEEKGHGTSSRSTRAAET